jgi:hypothetical protein
MFYPILRIDGNSIVIHKTNDCSSVRVLTSITYLLFDEQLDLAIKATEDALNFGFGKEKITV